MRPEASRSAAPVKVAEVVTSYRDECVQSEGVLATGRSNSSPRTAQ